MIFGMRYALFEEMPADGQPAPAAEHTAAPAAEPAATAEPTRTETPLDPPAEPEKPAATWPDDWRTKMANGDDKELARLQRFGSPSDVFSSFRQMETKMSDGSLRSAFPKDGSDEDKAAWRTANGVPEDAAGYHDTLPEGLDIGEEDAPFLDSFFERAAETGMPPEVVNASVDWYFQLQEQQAAQQAQVDTETRRATEDALNAEWGGEYRPNINGISSLLDMAPGDTKDILLNARGPDGVPIFNNPDVVKYMNHLSREINPAGMTLPEGGTNNIASMESRINEIQGIMKNNPSQYWGSDAMQKELLQLNEGLIKLRARAA